MASRVISSSSSGGDRIAEPLGDKRIFVSLAGHYSLGDARLFACRAVNISTHEITVAAPVTADIGVPVIANIEQLGRIEGSIIRVFKLGFAIDIEASDQVREMLATRIDWVERNKDFEIIDNRANARFIPRDPLSLLTLADGAVLPCFVVDISVSGAAISARVVPKIGAVLAVGMVVGRVVRHIAGGFAVQFIGAQNRAEVEQLVIRK
jgi:hypothetical protein